MEFKQGDYVVLKSGVTFKDMIGMNDRSKQKILKKFNLRTLIIEEASDNFVSIEGIIFHNRVIQAHGLKTIIRNIKRQRSGRNET